MQSNATTSTRILSCAQVYVVDAIIIFYGKVTDQKITRHGDTKDIYDSHVRCSNEVKPPPYVRSVHPFFPSSRRRRS